MSKNATAADRKTLSARMGASPKLLQRKALEKADASPPPEGAALEDSFPVEGKRDETPAAEPSADATMTEQPAPDDTAEPVAPAPAPDVVPQEGAAPPAALAPIVGAPTWSAQDEAAFQALTARRKASGYRGRGRQLSTQLIRLGDIKPNPGTVVATIVGLVPERGTIARGELVALMATATFESAKARPTDTSWCQGYVAGAIRSGFLVEGVEAVVADATA